MLSLIDITCNTHLDCHDVSHHFIRTFNSVSQLLHHSSWFKITAIVVGQFKHRLTITSLKTAKIKIRNCISPRSKQPTIFSNRKKENPPSCKIAPTSWQPSHTFANHSQIFCIFCNCTWLGLHVCYIHSVNRQYKQNPPLIYGLGSCYSQLNTALLEDRS